MSKSGLATVKLGLFFLSLGVSLLRPPYQSFRFKAEQFCQRRLRRDDNDLSSLWFLGNLYVWHKEYGSAKGPLERFVAAKKEERGALQLLSRVYFNLGDYEGVVRILNGGELLNPQDSENYYMGASLLELGRFEAAAEFLRIYTAHYKTDWEVFVRLGYARYCAGLYDLAAESYEMAERLNPSAPEIGESIARCRAKLKSRASK